MVVEELHIPGREGTTRIVLDGRITVVAGLDPAARARTTDAVVAALAHPGPAPDEDALRRLVVVTAADLGLSADAADPLVAAERAAAAAARRQMETELAAIEAAATEADRLRAELVVLSGDDAGAPGPTRDALLAASPAIDHLLLRRRQAVDRLARIDAAMGPFDAAHAGDGTAPVPDDLGTGVLASRAVLRRIDALRAEHGGDGPLADALASEREAARAVLARGMVDLDAHRRVAEQDLADVDRALAELAGDLGVDVAHDGAGAALTRAVRAGLRPTAGPSAAALPDHPTPGSEPAPRDDRQAALAERIAELPTPDDVRAARRRLHIVTTHLARLGGEEPPVDGMRNVLLGRVAALRRDGAAAALPLVLDDPLVALDPGTRCDLLEVLARVAERAQVLVLTGDDVVLSWARGRAARGQLRLVEADAVPAADVA